MSIMKYGKFDMLHAGSVSLYCTFAYIQIICYENQPPGIGQNAYWQTLWDKKTEVFHVMMLSVATFIKCQWQMNKYSYELLRKWYWHGKTEVPWEACPSATSSTTYPTWTGPECSRWSDSGTVFTSSTTSVFSFHMTLFSFLAGKRKRVEYVT